MIIIVDPDIKEPDTRLDDLIIKHLPGLCYTDKVWLLRFILRLKNTQQMTNELLEDFLHFVEQIK